MLSRLNQLQVIELQLNKDNNVNLGHTLKAMRLLTGAFCPESCIRQVMVFFNISKPERFEEHYQAVEKLATQSRRLNGAGAYAFLLSWATGGEYRIRKDGSKLSMFNDPHILGKFKDKWTDFSKSKDEEAEAKQDFTKIINLLLTDAHQIRHKIESKWYGEGDTLRGNLDVVIANVIFSRANNFPVVYEKMHEKNYKLDLIAFLQEAMKILKGQLDKSSAESLARNGIFNKYNRYNELVECLQAVIAEEKSDNVVGHGYQS